MIGLNEICKYGGSKDRRVSYTVLNVKVIVILVLIDKI